MKFRILTCGLLAVGFLSSCSSSRDTLSYFQDIDTQTAAVELKPGEYMPKIEPADELLITISSAHPELSAEYNLPLINPATADESFLGTGQLKQSTYFVSPEGDIDVPMLGVIHVAGMTTEELAVYLKNRISKVVEDPTVIVRLVDYTVNVAGEVLNPGTYKVNRERFSILDALSTAGDLTPFGERTNILLIREENGKRVAHNLDLTSADLLSSPYFYVKQNDYIYVAPNKIRNDNAKYNQNNAYKLTVISTVVSAASVIASLVIALTIK